MITTRGTLRKLEGVENYGGEWKFHQNSKGGPLVQLGCIILIVIMLTSSVDNITEGSVLGVPQQYSLPNTKTVPPKQFLVANSTSFGYGYYNISISTSFLDSDFLLGKIEVSELDNLLQIGVGYSKLETIAQVTRHASVGEFKISNSSYFYFVVYNQGSSPCDVVSFSILEVEKRWTSPLQNVSIPYGCIERLYCGVCDDVKDYVLISGDSVNNNTTPRIDVNIFIGSTWSGKISVSSENQPVTHLPYSLSPFHTTIQCLSLKGCMLDVEFQGQLVFKLSNVYFVIIPVVCFIALLIVVAVIVIMARCKHIYGSPTGWFNQKRRFNASMRLMTVNSEDATSDTRSEGAHNAREGLYEPPVIASTMDINTSSNDIDLGERQRSSRIYSSSLFEHIHKHFVVTSTGIKAMDETLTTPPSTTVVEKEEEPISTVSDHNEKQNHNEEYHDEAEYYYDE